MGQVWVSETTVNNKLIKSYIHNHRVALFHA